MFMPHPHTLGQSVYNHLRNNTDENKEKSTSYQDLMMYPLKIAFSSYAIIGITLLIVAITVAVYLSHLTTKTKATRTLILFFWCIALSGGATLLTNSLVHWGRFFTPWQDFWILAGGIALIQFAYILPDNKVLKETKAVTISMGSLVLLALVYCVIFSFNFLFNWSPELGVSDFYYLLLPIGTLGIVLLFIKRCVEVSAQYQTSNTHLTFKSFLEHLIHPKGNNAKVLRNFAFALSLAFLPGFQTLFQFPGILGFILSNFGSILAIVTIAMVYLNYAPEIGSFMAKLVGITLATVLLIFAVFGSIDVYQRSSEYSANRINLLASLHQFLKRSNSLLADPPQVAYIVSWDTLNPQNRASFRQLYTSSEEIDISLEKIFDENQDGFIETWSQPISGVLSRLTNDDWQFIQRFWSYPQGSTHADYQGYIFTDQNIAFEVGFSSATLYSFQNNIVLRWLILLLLSSVIILLIFPVFFHRTMVDPLKNLLSGVSQVNQGELDAQIPVKYQDEIGFLTKSFNQMVDSLKRLTLELKDKANDLEVQVNQRTSALIQANKALEMENEERDKAQTRLNDQLGYQQALANCSQMMLKQPENGTDHRVILDQALEELRSATQASRAYIFRNFNDPTQGLCISMIAEVCARGIQPQINNPDNQQFPTSLLPEEFVNNLASGKHFGGSTAELFASTPELKEAFLNQRNPLLSIEVFPIFMNDKWWGFIGFDDCVSVRQWQPWELTLLRTASEMAGNTLQRWMIEDQLKETLNELEQRVDRRTEELKRINIELNKEIQERQNAQKNVEIRLQIEEQLAKISARLLQPYQTQENIRSALADLGKIMNAGRIFLIEFDPQVRRRLWDFKEWHSNNIQPLDEGVVQGIINALSGLEDQLRRNEIIYIKDMATFEFNQEIDINPLRARNVQSLVLSPLIIDNHIRGILGCSNILASQNSVQENIRALELVSGMLRNLFRRETLIQTLEEQVAERTRQLTAFLDMAMLREQSADLADLLQPTMHSIAQIADCDAISIHIVNEGFSHLELIAQRGIPLDSQKKLGLIEIDSNLLDWMDKGEPFESLGNFAQEGVFPQAFFVPDFHAFLASCLSTGSKPHGILSCLRYSDQSFSPFQKTFLTAIGDLLGIIVENFHLRIEAAELATIEERQRLAREIHDAISQAVYSLSLFARSAKDAADEDDHQKLTTNLEDIERTAIQAMREMRLLLYQLRESGQEMGLETSLENRFQQVENRLGIQTSLEINDELFLPAEVRHQIWRILVESLNNAVKHAIPTKVDVKINCLEEQLVVIIQDNGIGFDVNASSPGMGLKNIYNRAEILDGYVEIVSEIGRGTEIIVKLPRSCLNPEKME
jgi:nitrate/nitrite-specific signal transduction histidine kinase